MNQGDRLVFMGSGNETAEGLTGNYEELRLFPSWEEPSGRNERLRSGSRIDLNNGCLPCATTANHPVSPASPASRGGCRCRFAMPS